MYDFDYIKLISLLQEINRLPGGKKAPKKMLDLASIMPSDKVLDVGCNSGFCTLETARLKKAQVTGVDISADMISSAKALLTKEADSIQKIVTYQQGDAMNLDFSDKVFDFVFSGGSTVFVSNIPKVLKEYKRVVKDWGMIGELVFFYKNAFPTDIVNEINKKLNINIQYWNLDWWLNQYKSAGLEIFEYYVSETEIVDLDKISDYVDTLVDSFIGSQENRNYISTNKAKLIDLYSLFNKNNQYLMCGIFILRNRFLPEEPYLFAP